MSDGAKLGLAAAVKGLAEALAEAHTRAAASAAPAGGQELAAPGDLFGVVTAAETGAKPIESNGRAGRPVGAVNKRSDSLKRYILGLGFKHPAIVLADIASASVPQLRRQVAGLKAGEALSLKVRAAEALMPYFEQKLPTAIELPPNDRRPVLIIGEMEAPRHPGSGEAMSLDDAVDDLLGVEPLSEQDQALSEAENGRPEFSVPTDEG